MARNPRNYIDGFCYHIVQRRINKELTFHCNGDFEKLLFLCRKYKLKFRNKIYAYCIMDNHFHLLIEPFDAKALVGFMHGINMSYAQYYNNKYDKCGHLWQNRYKSYIITRDSYIYNCVNYIEYNPVRAAITDKPENFKWSSYNGRNGISKNILLDDIIL